MTAETVGNLPAGGETEPWKLIVTPLGAVALAETAAKLDAPPGTIPPPPPTALALLNAYSRGYSEPARMLVFLKPGIRPAVDAVDAELDVAERHYGARTRAQAAFQALRHRHLRFRYDRSSVLTPQPARLREVLGLLVAGHEPSGTDYQNALDFLGARTSGHAIRRGYELRILERKPKPPQYRMAFSLPPRDTPKLSSYEKRAIIGRSRGLTNKRVGGALGRVEDTQKRHITHALDKLKAASAVEAMSKLIVLGRLRVARPAKVAHFTKPEIDYASQFACGNTYGEIASMFGVDVSIVNSVLRAARLRAKVKSTMHLVAYLFGADVFTVEFTSEGSS